MKITSEGMRIDHTILDRVRLRVIGGLDPERRHTRNDGD
jgi:hypothetical protein